MYALQHDEIGHGKLDHVEESSHSLLENGRSEPWCCCCFCIYETLRRSRIILARGDLAAGDGRECMLADEVAVVFLDGAAQELKGHGQENDADA